MREIFVDSMYEQRGTVLQRDDIILDCGANIGLFSIYAARRLEALGGGGRIYALEPVPQFATIIQANIQELRNCGVTSPIEVIEKATTSRTEEVTIFLDRSCFTSTSMVEQRTKQGVPITIRCVPIDDLVAQLDLPRVDFIKMDIEGMEIPALEGARGTIRRWKPRLAIAAYHFKGDVYDIPKLIYGVRSDYQIEVLRGRGPICYAW